MDAAMLDEPTIAWDGGGAPVQRIFDNENQ